MLAGAAGAIILLITCWIYYGPWQELCTDMARDTIFEKRSELFELASSGKLDFNDPNYRTIRSALEANIRFAHELTIWRFLIIRYHLRKAGLLGRKPDVVVATEAIKDKETRMKVRALVDEATQAAVGMMLLKSPLLLLFLLPLIGVTVLIAFVVSQQERVKSAISSVSNSIQQEAEACCA